MNYVSTRGGIAEPVGFTDGLLGGLAPDGGLVVPQAYPQVDAARLARWRHLGYRDLAFEILSLYATDMPAAALRTAIDAAYTAEKFGSEAITPVVALGPELHLLELSNGPTLAFKDVAMQLLGQLFAWALRERGARLNILGATSGDTGSAAEYAMRGLPGIRVFMLSPHGRMSAFQRAQMFSLRDANIFNIAIPGVFDDCQDLVKAVSSDAAFKQRHAIGAVNSINWARVVAQVVYYFRGYFAVTHEEGQPVSFAVPSGNFGNVLAGHIARMMGLPIRRLVVATNENHVLEEFFRTGVYRARGRAETLATSSPSMDIGKASNFERFVHDLVGRDPERVRVLWAQLEATGSFDLSGTPEFAAIEQRFGFVAGRSTHANRIATIRAVHERYGRTIDPHTADGVFVAHDHLEAGVPMVCLETALPVKFADTIREALGHEPAPPAALATLAQAAQRFTLMPASAALLKDFIARHETTPAR